MELNEVLVFIVASKHLMNLLLSTYQDDLHKRPNNTNLDTIQVPKTRLSDPSPLLDVITTDNRPR